MGRKTGRKHQRQRQNDRDNDNDDDDVHHHEGSASASASAAAASSSSSSSCSSSSSTPSREVVVNDTGQRLDAFVARELRITRSRVARAAKAGVVTVDGKVAKPSQKLRPGQIVLFRDAERPPLKVAPEDLQLRVLFSFELGLKKNPSKVDFVSCMHLLAASI